MSIDNLLRIEITLSNIYYRLLMLEIYGEVESGEYTTNLKMLLNILKEESKILDSYTIEELEVIKEIITGKRIETNIDNIFISDIINRLEKNIIRLLESKRTEKLNNNVRKKVLEVYNLMSLVEFERTDIYLSFLDEEIKDTFIINKKNTLRTNKYIIISELEPKNITRISKRRFQTDKSLYLDSLLYSASLGYSNNSYLIVKRKIAELHLEKMHKSIINDEIESKDNDIKILFRTIMLLFSNEEYKVVIDKITNNKNILNMYLNYFGQDIIKIIGNDRQRHKTLSLRK
ncbi:MAG: hypothetical protein SO167_02280 [Bacilli bacterium]|nr:hypothetical protein [Bacilli bacterium]